MKIKKELTANPVLINLTLIPAAIVLSLAMIIPPFWWHGSAAYKDWTIDNTWVLIVIYIAGVVVHEAIHGFTWMKAGRLQPSDIRYGIIWKALMPFAHSKKPLNKRAYQLGTAMPGITLGLLPYTLGCLFPIPELFWFGFLFTVVALGDAWILWAIRHEPADALILDHPNKPGCYVVESDATTVVHFPSAV